METRKCFGEAFRRIVAVFHCRVDNLFISARQRTNLDTLRRVLYNKVRELHVQKYPYNDFLFEHYEAPYEPEQGEVD